uniref:DX domain-containing protein n=2 Tax=Caenorhabditis tropicalis TaxID=1561998 RepID=A0A1I7SZM8_9PELO
MPLSQSFSLFMLFIVVCCFEENTTSLTTLNLDTSTFDPPGISSNALLGSTVISSSSPEAPTVSSYSSPLTFGKSSAPDSSTSSSVTPEILIISSTSTIPEEKSTSTVPNLPNTSTTTSYPTVSKTKTTRVQESSDLRTLSTAAKPSDTCPNPCKIHFDPKKCSKSGVPFRPIPVRCPEGCLDTYATDSTKCDKNDAPCSAAIDCLNIVEKEHPLYCPDWMTPLMNEPKCDGSREEDLYSGTCPMKNGMCKHGHCCPTNKTDTLSPGKPYKTNLGCTRNTVISRNQTNGFCDPETGRVHIMSELNEFNQKNLALESYCLSGRDCGKAYGMNNVCVRVNNDNLRCYINPKVSLKIGFRMKNLGISGEVLRSPKKIALLAIHLQLFGSRRLRLCSYFLDSSENLSKR